LWNLAPRGWWGAKKDQSRELRSIAVVSNHVPEEIAGLERLVTGEGIAFRIFGRDGHEYLRVSPQTLIPFDVVVSIGKTVQYCLAAGLPVFVYDHFGGPGWLTEANIHRAESRNYSGKCTWNRRSSDQLWGELKEGFAAAQAFYSSQQAWAIDHYGIGQQIERLDLFDPPEKPVPLLKNEATRTTVKAHAVGIIRSAFPKDRTLSELAKKLGPTD